MRGLLLCVFFIGIFQVSLAQLPGNFNLVPNPGFEFNAAEYNGAFDTDFVNNRICWIAANRYGNPLIYYAPSDQRFRAHTGTSAAWMLSAMSSSGYLLGSNQWIIDTTSEIVPYQETRLLTPLVAGTTYYFTMYIGEYKSTDTAQWNNDVLGNIGVYFSTNKIGDYSIIGRINVTPQIRFVNWDVPLYDTCMYTKLTAAYTATGGEQYMTIGNFDYFSQQHFVYLSPFAIAHGVTFPLSDYPLLDDISLVSDTTQPMVSLSEFNLGNDTVLCPGQSLTLGGQPNFFHYWWSTGDTTRFITVNQPGAYWCKVDYGCNTYTDTLNLLSPIPASFHLPDTALCPGQVYTVSAPQGYPSYLWSTGDSTVTVMLTDTGTYWLQIGNVCGAPFTDTFHITSGGSPIPPFNIADTLLCPGQNYTATGPAGYAHYLWSTGDTTVSRNISAPGAYWLQISNCGYSYTDTFHVINNNVPVVPFNIADTSLCSGQSYTVNAPVTAPHYLWSNADTAASINISAAGTYWLYAGNNCGIGYTDTFSESQAVSSINLGNDTVICNASQSYTISVPATLQNILWSTGGTGTAITITQPGTYWVQAQSACGLLSDTIQISSCIPVIDTLISADTICTAECITVSAQTHNYPQTFNWSFTGGNPSSFQGTTPPQICYANAGVYSIKLVVANAGGADSQVNSITVLPKPAPSFIDTPITVPYNTIVTLPACADAMHIQWFYQDSLVCDGCSSLTLTAKNYQSLYRCVVDNAGCSDTCNYKIMVTGIPTDVWLPTAFTPNGDGLNDYFHMLTDNPNISLVELSVYNRYGQKVYDATVGKGWDGTFSGTRVDMDTYFWYLRYKVSAGTDVIYTKKGDVTVVR